MGCIQSLPFFSSRSKKYEVSGEDALAQQQPYSWERADRPDPKDYMFSGLKGEVKIKEPGSVDGQGFLIDNCEDCDLYIFDHMAQITIDDCVNCRIFIGPVAGSMFIRDCKDCQCTMICRQFRTRDCHNCDFLIMCSTRPIIESSAKLRFGCYDLGYKGLKDHLSAVTMNHFQNHWSSIYDFTPKDGNYELLPEETSSKDLLKALGEASCTSDVGQEDMPLVILGDRETSLEGFLWALFPPAKAKDALQFARSAAQQARLSRTNAVMLSKDQIMDIAAKADWDGNKMSKSFLGGRSVGIELVGAGEELVSMAEATGALVTRTEAAAVDYRALGIEG